MSRNGMTNVAITSIVVFLVGCGTLDNLFVEFVPTETRPYPWTACEVYGGIKTDLFKLSSLCLEPKSSTFEVVGSAVYIGATTIDLPFSAIGDTLTLPITIPATREYARRDAAQPGIDQP